MRTERVAWLDDPVDPVILMTCNDAYVLIVRTIDDARLSGAERAVLRRHLASCSRCRAEYETQHDVRRLLALHIEDRPPAGFDERLSARLSRTSRPLTADAMRGVSVPLARTRGGTDASTPAPLAAPRWPEAADACRPDTRGRIWALRLIPLAATLALIVAGTSVRDVNVDVDEVGITPAPIVSSDAPSSTRSASGQPRAFTTIVLPRNDGASRRHRPSPSPLRSPSSVSTDDLTHSRAQQPQAAADEHPRVPGAPSDFGTALENASASRNAKDAPEPSSDVDERVPPTTPRGDDRKRIADRKLDDDHDNDGRAERATSQRPGILPRPATPFPHVPNVRPAMPAPPAPPGVIPDRSVPPW